MNTFYFLHSLAIVLLMIGSFFICNGLNAWFLKKDAEDFLDIIF